MAYNKYTPEEEKSHLIILLGTKDPEAYFVTGMKCSRIVVRYRPLY